MNDLFHFSDVPRYESHNVGSKMEQQPVATLAGVVLFPGGRVEQIKVSIKKPVSIAISS